MSDQVIIYVPLFQIPNVFINLFSNPDMGYRKLKQIFEVGIVF